MMISLNGEQLYAYTGGKAFNPDQPTVVFIHGVLNDHSVWALQARYFAHHGHNVLAIDLPGHCRSSGNPPTSVQEAAQTVLALLNALDIKRAALVGHSFGSLIALQTAAEDPRRISHLGLVGTAFPMRVSQALLEASLHEPAKAIHMVNVFSHSTLAPPPSTLGPGSWVPGGLLALMRRVLASNPRANLFHTGFKACDSYQDGESAMTRVNCPVVFVLGRADQMTPPHAAQVLQKTAAAHAQTVLLPAGHALMSEAPDGVLNSLLKLLQR